MSHVHQCEEPEIVLSEARPARRFAGLLKAVISTMAMWLTVGRTRAQLSELTDDELADIGITRDQAAKEAARPFWIYRERPRD